jgi:hypothetical protein
MQTHVKRNSRAMIALALTCQVALAQTASPTAGAPAPTPAPAAPTSVVPGNNITEVDSSTSTALDYLFNHKAGEGTTMKAGNEVASAIADKIKAVDVLKTPGLDDPAMRARFETYISLKEVPQARIDEYFGKMKQISAMLKQGQSQDLFGAWKLLYSLGEYQDLDAGISKELASRVENFWNTDRTKNGLEIANNKYRGDIETSNHNADLDAADMAHDAAAAAQKQGKGNNNNNNSANNSSSTNSTPQVNFDADPTGMLTGAMPTMTQSLVGKVDMTSEYLNILESRAKIKLNEIRENKMDDQDRMDFSDYIKTLYKDHRFYHVILAADFYRALFNEGEYPTDVSNQVVAGATGNARQAADGVQQVRKTMGMNNNAVNIANQAGNLLGANPLTGGNGGAGAGADEQPLSIADEVTSAYEINNRVGNAIEVFTYKAGKGEIASAAEQLQEAFVGNEYHPALQGLARDSKEQVGDFLTKLDVLKNQLEVRDFEQVEGQIAAIKKIATDFDSTKPMALVNAIKLESRLRLGKAQLLAQSDNLTAAMQEFQTAAEEWPGNPDLNTMSGTFFKTQNVQNQSTGDFDRLVQDQNYRQLFDRQLEFALAVKGDSTREQQLKDAIEKVTKAKMAEEKANMLVMNGDVDGAWETVELAAKDWPDDMKLNKLLANLSGRSADFVSALDKAREAEAKKELGYSLTWFVNAQGLYPASTIANEGIDRVSKQILTPQASSPGQTE